MLCVNSPVAECSLVSQSNTGTRCSGLPCWLHSCFSAPSVGSFCRVQPAHPVHQSTQTPQLDLWYPKHTVRPCDCLLQTLASCRHAGHAEHADPAEHAAAAEHVDSAEYAAATVAAQAARYAALKPQHLMHCMPASACCVACWHRATQLPVLAQLERYSLLQLPCPRVRLMPQWKAHGSSYCCLATLVELKSWKKQMEAAIRELSCQDIAAIVAVGLEG